MFLIRVGLVFAILLLVVNSAFAGSWISLGPEGGDARSLAYDPAAPDHIYLGTSSGELYVSNDNGETWIHFIHLGPGFDYVLDNIKFDPKDSNIIYVAAWSADNNNDGDVFKSTDHGKTWKALPGIHGKSVRALAIAPSDSNILVAGAIDGVYSSSDAGQTWQKISSASNSSLTNFYSVAIDPRNPQVIYAGTWHLPWKTEDGGKTWVNIKNGVIDDSDVFSIILDHQDPNTVYASACSGIYKSENAGALFKKVQGIPFTARRTRKLKQDPSNPAVVYAGTTEGLWRTKDAGANWSRISSPSFIVNDVMIDPRNPEHVLVATDRTGVIVSQNGGASFEQSNRGFAHRQVTSLVAVREHPDHLYVSMVNNREYGGVYRSTDGGKRWEKFETGLGTRDVFTLQEASDGRLVAGTNDGVYAFEDHAWTPINTILTEKTVEVPNPKRKKKSDPKTITKQEWKKTELKARVLQLNTGSDHWYAATSDGLYRSLDAGKSWTGGPVLGHVNFISVASNGQSAVAVTPDAVVLSRDNGESWNELKLPPFVSRLHRVALGPGDSSIWITSHMGTFRSNDDGQHWEHIMAGQPLTNVSYVGYDPQTSLLIAVAGSRRDVYQSRDGNQWTLTAASPWSIRNIVVSNGRIFAVTEFSGVVQQAAEETSAITTSGGGTRE
ncbi:MAG TPA: hypothetical protein VMU28_03410 [Terriglobales bacterium]|nr:hypothetical protein [Terriglobales bacterium]